MISTTINGSRQFQILTLILPKQRVEGRHLSLILCGRNFCVDIVNLKRLILILNVSPLKFKEQCLIPQLKLSLQGMTIMDFEEEFN